MRANPGASPLAALFLREIRVARRIGGGGVMGVVFFLDPRHHHAVRASGPDLNLLSRIGPAILWIAALLATLLGLDRLFQADHEDGSLDLMLACETPLELIVLVKCLAHWTVTGLPLVIAAPLFGLMLALEPDAFWASPRSLLVGTPALTLLGAIGAALTVDAAARRPADRDPRPAAGHSAADLRRLGGRLGDLGDDALPDAVPDPLRA